MPVSPFPAACAFDPRNDELRRRRIAFGIVPHEQHSVLLEGGPLRGAGELGHPLAVRHPFAPPVAAAAPIVKRAGDLIALHLALGEVPAHVSAMPVERVDLAVAAAEDHQLMTERVVGMGLAVANVICMAN